MFEFGYFYSTILPVVGRIFGLISYWGSLSLNEFIQLLTDFWIPFNFVEFTNLFTGQSEILLFNGFGNILLQGLKIATTAFTPIFKALVFAFNVDPNTPFWAVCLIYILFMSVLFAIVKGLISLLAKVV